MYFIIIEKFDFYYKKILYGNSSCRPALKVIPKKPQVIG